MKLEEALKISNEVYYRLKPHCERLMVAGSIRRHKPNVNDIDIVLIPKDREKLDGAITQLGNQIIGGAKIKRVSYKGTQIDIYYATPEIWATLLLIRTGSKENNIRLCSAAKRKGWKLHATGNGLFNEKGDKIAGDSEESIYKALGLKYQEPWERS